MNVDENLLNVINTLANPNEDHEMPKLTVLDDQEEKMKS